MKVIIHTDGGSRGNPGPAAAGFTLDDADGHRLLAQAFFLGKTTNNVAEYTALVKALEAAEKLGAEHVTVYSDSELMVRQLSGAYKVKSEAIRPLFEQVNDLRSQFDSCLIRHVMREKNEAADRIVNQALDARRDVEEKPAQEDHRSAGGITKPALSRSHGAEDAVRSVPVRASKEGSSSKSEASSSGPALQTSNLKLQTPPETPHGVTTNVPQEATAKKRIRLGILISGGGRTMTNLLDCIRRGELNAEIVIVISSLSAVAGVGRARSAGLPLKIVRKKDCADLDAFSRQIVEELDAAQVDLVVQGGWLCLWKIPPQYENRVMNIHPALLPSFGGQGMWGHHVHEAVLAAGCKVSGCTVHFCTNEYDQGPIIVQRTCPVQDDDTPEALADRVFEQECLAYPEAIQLFAAGRLQVEGNRVKVKR
jgi:formyltetrahydrofolate-dependent phosphoribosylglycinamide formyltransferase